MQALWDILLEFFSKKSEKEADLKVAEDLADHFRDRFMKVYFLFFKVCSPEIYRP